MEPPKPLLMKLKEALTAAMKAQNTDQKDALRVLLGNVQTLETRVNKATDEQIFGLIKTLIGQNEEEIASRLKAESGAEKYKEAILSLTNKCIFLKTFLPRFVNEEQIVAVLSIEDNLQQINSAKDVGPAVGVSLQILKSMPQFAGMGIDGKLVKEIVQKIYKKQG